MYKEKTFTIPSLQGLSEKTIEEHKKLYAGYVKHANLILEKLESYKGDETKTYETGELYRRFSFEYNGIRNHELYFALLEKKTNLSEESSLAKALTKIWGSTESFVEALTTLALTRGIGWAMLSYDNADKKLLLHWIDEQHLGQLQGVTPIIALDMWEHSYVADYQPSGKKQYVADFISQMNWELSAKIFEDLA